MKTFTSILSVGALALLVAGCNDKSTPSTPPSAPMSSLSNTLAGTKNNSDKTIDVGDLNQALQLYNVQEGHYPKTLDELKPNYVAQLPILPPDCKLNYDSTKGEVKIVQQ